MITTIFDELDSQMKAKLSGIVVRVDNALQEVPVMYAYPEEWYSQTTEEARKADNERQYPIIAFHRYLPEFDRLRSFGVGVDYYPSPSDPNLYVVDNTSPYRLSYQVEVITEFTRHRNQLQIEILRRLPHFGFGTTLTVYPNTPNQKDFPFECVHVAEDKQPLGRYSEKRKFRDIYIYQFQLCLPLQIYENGVGLYEEETLSKILSIGVDLYTESAHTSNIELGGKIAEENINISQSSEVSSIMPIEYKTAGDTISVEMTDN